MNKDYRIVPQNSTLPKPAFRGSLPPTEEVWRSLLRWAKTAGSAVQDKAPHKQLLGYPFNRTGCRLRRWITLVLARTIRGPWASSRPGSAPMRTVLDYLEWL